VKLRRKDAEHLERKYHGLSTINNGKQGTRIEGTLVHEEVTKFHFDLEVMKLEYKIEELIIKKEDMINSILPKVNVDDDDPVFPF
jgi:hypothetical protein